jgi:hypothetical protein
MKRNMDLARDLLLFAEDGNGARIAQYSPDDCAGHFLILKDAGLVLGVVSGNDMNPGRYMIHRLTWQGHEFLQSMRDDTVWKKAKEHVLIPGASWTFDLLKEWAKHEIQSRLGIPVA